MAGRPKKAEAQTTDLALPEPKEQQKIIRKTAGTSDLSNEDNRKYVSHAVDALAYPTVDIYNEEEVWQRTQIYINSCKRNNQRPSPPGLANWFGISTEELRDWMIEPGTAEHRRLATRLYEMLRASWADYALQGKIPASVAIFAAKNWFAMSDVSKVSDAPQVQKQLDLEKLAAEAAALPDADIIDQ